MPESAFRSQAAWLAENTHVVTLSDGIERLASGNSDAAGRPMVAVTFDDGYADNASAAAPILEEAGLRGTFFLTTNFVGEREPMWFDRALLGLQRNSEERNAELARRFCGEGDTRTPRQWLGRMKHVEPAVRSEWIEALDAPDPDVLRDFAPMTVDEARGLHERGHEVGAGANERLRVGSAIRAARGHEGGHAAAEDVGGHDRWREEVVRGLQASSRSSSRSMTCFWARM